MSLFPPNRLIRIRLGYSWTGVPDIILFTQDNNGDENTMLFKKNISSAAITADRDVRVVISNQPGVKALILANNQRASHVVVGLNDVVPS